MHFLCNCYPFVLSADFLRLYIYILQKVATFAAQRPYNVYINNKGKLRDDTEVPGDFQSNEF